jgi:hypothetical protein
VRAYLVELQAAVTARLHHHAMPAAPAVTDPRSHTYITIPMLGPYEAAKADGSVALLGIDRIRIYNRLADQYRFLEDALDNYRYSTRALRAFTKRFDSSPALAGITFTIPPARLETLSTAQLVEYQGLIATAVEAIDQLVSRLARVDIQGRAILDGARDENELIEAVANASDDASVPPAAHR